MAASKWDIEQWFDGGTKMGATHMAVFCDTHDYEDYPIYVMPGENARETVESHNARLMEVYDLRMDKATQMAEHRAFHY